MVNFNKQRGVSLFIGLMFLLILTIIGLSSSNVSLMQERMAGNVADSHAAFQQAERTLREMEERLTRFVSGGFGGLATVPPTWEETGLSRNDCTMSGYDWDSVSWNDAPDSGGQYFIVDLSEYTDGGQLYGSSCRPVSEAGTSTAGQYFLVAARAVSPTGNSEAIVQSIFFWPQ